MVFQHHLVVSLGDEPRLPEHRGQRLWSSTFAIEGHNEREAGTAQAAALQESPGGTTYSPEQVELITRMIAAACVAEGGREGARAAAAAKATLVAEAEAAAVVPDGKRGQKGGKGSKGKGERLVGFGPNGAIIGGSADVPRLVEQGVIPEGVNGTCSDLFV